MGISGLYPCTLVLTVLLYLLYSCTYCTLVLTVLLCLLYSCAHCTLVLTVFLCSLYSCGHCTLVLTVLLYLLYSCTYCTLVLTVLLYSLYSCHYSTICYICFRRSTLLWVQPRTRIVIADTPLFDQDGRGGISEQPVMDISQAEKNL